MGIADANSGDALYALLLRIMYVPGGSLPAVFIFLRRDWRFRANFVSMTGFGMAGSLEAGGAVGDCADVRLPHRASCGP